MMERVSPLLCEPDFSGECAMHSADTCVSYKTVNDAPLYIGLFYTGDLYTAREPRPLYIIVHGGGWQGKKVFPDQAHWMGDYLGYLARYYANRGCLCACIDYRLMREGGQAAGAELIDLYEDCMDAAAYLRAHAEEYYVDQKRVMVLGESAGGYLAAAMVTLPLRDASFIRATVLVNTITDLSDDRWQQRIARASAHPLLAGRCMDEKTRLLSPVMNIRKGLCPVLLLHGENDTVVYPWHSQKFYDAAASVGANAELDWIEDTEHAFLLVEYMREKEKSAGAAGIAVRMLDKWLASNHLL